MKFELKEYNKNVSDQDLLDDLIRVAAELNKSRITANEYNELGKFSHATFKNRFDTWNNSLEKAGLKIVLKHKPSENELFENIEELSIKLGRQPTHADLKRPHSEFSRGPYETRYGTFMNALRAFVEFINSEKDEEIEKNTLEVIQEEEIFKHKTKRNPSERLKVQVLMRDGNKCRLCGITLTGDNIHFDHIVAWSKGGETVLENLQVLCEQHNLAKGNL